MELIIIMVIVLLIFGVGRLPEIGGALGRGIREFRKAHTGDEDSQRESKTGKQKITTETGNDEQSE